MGVIIGAGVFILTGIVAATKAGPGIVFSFLLAGASCVCSALSYAELASSIGGCGSAYSYAYAGFGEFVAWVIGWDLLLEYGVSCPTVAIGWSGYVNTALKVLGLNLPNYIAKGPFEGGIINLPSVFIIIILTLFLAIGVKQSSRFNNLIVFTKLAVIALFIIVALPHFKLNNWQPFLPFGWQGVINGAAVIFFAYIGFDALSTTAEEAIKPQRDLPIGILSSLAICTFIYILVSAILTGIAHYTTLNVTSPISATLLQLNHPYVAGITAFGAILGLTTVILVMYYGFTRIFLAMARDGLLPHRLARIHPATKTPIRIIFLVGLFMIIIAGLLPMSQATELVNIGTLAAFTLVNASVIILRHSKPNLPRPFKLPFFPIIPIIGALLSFYLMLSLSYITWLRFVIWFSIGVIIYFSYSYRHSALNKR